MKKILFPLSSILVAALVFMIITSQKLPDKKKFYYAFNEKIFIDEVPDQFLIQFKDKAKAEKHLLRLVADIPDRKKIQAQTETIITLDVKGSMKNIGELLNDKMGDIEIIKPAYRYQQQLMYYANEILVEPKEGQTIYDVIKKNKLEAFVKIKEGKFYSVVEIAATYDACDIANQIQESGLVTYSHPNFFAPVHKTEFIPNDTYFNNQFYLKNTGQIFNPIESHAGTPGADINATWVWDITTGNNNIIVAVLDEGVIPK